MPDVEALREVAGRHLAPDGVDLLVSLTRPAVQLQRSAQPTRSHLGGRPRLAPGTEWPRWGDQPLAHVATLDLGELQGFELDLHLPDHGLVSFFYEVEEQMAWGFDPDHRDGWRVFLTDPARAVEVAEPHGASVSPRTDVQPAATVTIPSIGEPEMSPLHPDHLRIDGRLAPEQDPDDQRRREALWALWDEWTAVAWPTDTANHQVGGWPRLVQSSIWDECRFASQGFYVGNSYAEARAAATGSPDDWRLLLQLDTDEGAGWMWGDVGTLYFAVDTTKPPATAIPEAWMVLQCS